MSKKRIRHHVNPLSVQKEHVFEGFGNNRPIIVDIGADHGEFAAGLVGEFGATHNIILFEIRQPLVEALVRMFAGYDFVAIFDGDAVRNFRNIVEPCIADGAVIEEVFVNFPDPWFKKKHKKRRVITENFLQDCKKWMQAETTWVIQTDQAQLFADTEEVLDAVGVATREHFEMPPHDLTTKWEDAKVIEGAVIKRMRFHL